MFGFRRRRRRRLRARPLPPAWVDIVDRNVPAVRLLPPDDRRELFGHMQVFLHEKRFEGCGGLAMTDEIRVTIAAQACILLLHRDTGYFPTLRSILVYPHRYFADAARRQPDGTIVEGPEARLGESWRRGAVVLAWDGVRHGAADPHDGHNVVFHEFAHQLDGESGNLEGAPALPRRSMYLAWARVLGREYAQLVADVEHHRPTLLDGYGATNPAEFFAVATECFFERPGDLARRHPDLYEQLKIFYRQDPVRWPAQSQDGIPHFAPDPDALIPGGEREHGAR